MENRPMTNPCPPLLASLFFLAQIGLPAGPLAAQCPKAAPPPVLRPAYCQALEDSGVINAMCPRDPVTGDYAIGGTLYAQPNDACDDTEAIRRALGRAGTTRSVYLPGGDHVSVEGRPDHSNPYLVSGSINVGGRRLYGDLHSTASLGTVIKLLDGTQLTANPLGTPYSLPLIDPLDPADHQIGAVLFAKNQAAQIENLQIIGNTDVRVASADYGIYLYKAHGTSSKVSNVRVKRMRQVGILADTANGMLIESVTTEDNFLDGLAVINGNGNKLLGITSARNGRHGIVLSRVQNSKFSGGLSLSYCTVESNGSPGPPPTGHGIFVLGTTSALRVAHCWLEGNGGDGVRAEQAHNVSILYNRITGASPGEKNGESLNHSISLDECRHCIVRGNQIAAGRIEEDEPRYPNYEDITVTGALRFLYVTENIYDSGKGPTEHIGGTSGDFEVAVDLEDTMTRFNQHQNRLLAGAGPPSHGAWEKGDVVWNKDPDPCEPVGWVCIQESGDPQNPVAWLPFGRITENDPQTGLPDWSACPP